ncbi:LysR family transcriptional regulator [Roseibium denhamense]|uniref:LysR family transcriptional regulator, hydrogen peroxide-inducible genes activator n=2 Tax=Roseibium denhamense TaxID=76305 RepID=A0ABY1PFU7_9HYPH|nr:LysR substrate-binding domain-containing protein [Roseibium denhamense]MTI04755.1 LysR family transcriptional regulator [Roseibium denhamense]SMP33466.1 LysR family transcriptional regulator, hydrogen peroxide-inducible genes activator [Roseibium denhamense]
MPFRPSARQLEYFSALAEVLHFGKAADKCNVSQPTLSSQFKLLEESLETVLVERSAGVVSLTAAGERLLPMARQVLENLDEFVLAAKAGQGNLGGLIRLGVSSTFGPYFMPYLLPILKQAYPGLELYIREDRPGLLEEQLRSGVLDCVMTPDITRSDQIEDRILCHEAVVLAVPRTHPLAGVGVIPVSMLRGEKLLSLGQGFRLHNDVQELARAAGAEFRQDYEGTSLDAVRQMASIGMGLALFPAAYVASEFGKEPNLLLKRVEGVPLNRTMSLAWRKGSSRAGHFEKLLSLSREAVLSMQIDGVTLPPDGSTKDT